MMSLLAEDFDPPDIGSDTVSIPMLEGSEENQGFSLIVPTNHGFSGENYESINSFLSKDIVSSITWQSSSGKRKAKRIEQNVAPNSKRKKVGKQFGDQQVENKMENLLKLFQTLNQKQRLEYMKKLDACLDINNSITFAVHMLKKTMSRMNTQPENEKSTEFKKWLNKRAGIAAECFIACHGNNQEHNLLSVKNMLKRLNRSEKISTCWYFRSKEEIKDLQQIYTRMAAELYLRWKLTRNQYKIARQMLLGDGQMAKSNKSKIDSKSIVRINGSNKNSLVSRTIGLEIWPSVDAISKTVSAISNDVVLEPENVRMRGDDGRFVWKKKDSKINKPKKKQTKHTTKKSEEKTNEIPQTESSIHDQGCSSSSDFSKKPYETYNLEQEYNDSDLNFKW